MEYAIISNVHANLAAQTCLGGFFTCLSVAFDARFLRVNCVIFGIMRMSAEGIAARYYPWPKKNDFKARRSFSCPRGTAGRLKARLKGNENNGRSD